MGRDPSAALRQGSVAARDPRRTGLHRDTIRQGARQQRAAGLSAGAGGVEARSVQGRDPPAAARGPEAAGCPGPRAARAAGLHRVARRSSTTTCARSGRCSRRRRGRFSGRSIGRARSASSMSGSRARRCRSGTARRAAAGSSSRAWATRAPAPACWSSRTQTEDLLAGIAGCLERLGGLPRTLVWDRQAGIHGHGGRPAEAFAAFCGQLRVDWRFCEPADPQAKGASSGCRATRRRTSSPAARSPTSSTSRTSSTPGSRRSTRARTRRCGRGRSIASPTSWR